MTDLERLINAAENLSMSLEKASMDEFKFGIEISLILEKMSWEMKRTQDNLQEIRNYLL